MRKNCGWFESSISIFRDWNNKKGKKKCLWIRFAESENKFLFLLLHSVWFKLYVKGAWEGQHYSMHAIYQRVKRGDSGHAGRKGALYLKSSILYVLWYPLFHLYSSRLWNSTYIRLHVPSRPVSRHEEKKCYLIYKQVLHNKTCLDNRRTPLSLKKGCDTFVEG